MTVIQTQSHEQFLTATEIRKLPPAQRDSILQAAAIMAEQDYRDTSELADFEAFGKGESHQRSRSASVLREMI